MLLYWLIFARRTFCVEDPQIWWCACVCVSVCVSVCLSRSDRNWTGFETGYAVSRVVKHAKNTVFTTFLKKKDIFFAIFLNLFFTIFFATFSCIGLIIFKIFRELVQNMQFRVVFACILLQKPKKPLRNVDDPDDELDDASSVQIILIIRIVHIIFFRISTQKALRATLLRGCFLV